MKRILAGLALAALVAAGSAQLASADSVLHCEDLRWWTSLAASNGGGVDSVVFRAAGGANATRDTSRWVEVSYIAPQRSQPTGVGDSTIWVRVSIFPTSNTSFTAGLDSLYLYVQRSESPTLASHVGMTNMTEILALQQGSTAEATFPISWGRRPGEQGATQWLRFVVRGDYNGEFAGKVCYYTESTAQHK